MGSDRRKELLAELKREIMPDIGDLLKVEVKQSGIDKYEIHLAEGGFSIKHFATYIDPNALTIWVQKKEEK